MIGWFDVGFIHDVLDKSWFPWMFWMRIGCAAHTNNDYVVDKVQDLVRLYVTSGGFRTKFSISKANLIEVY